jgi:tetratricopeptide (TPR) repeat protein
VTQSDENPLQQIRDEADFIWQRVHANLPSGIVLERGQARSLTQDLSRVRELADLLQDREWRAQASIYLGYVFLRMDIGDAARNAEQAIAFVSEALETFTEEHHPREWAWACTTMGMLYNERYYQDQDRSNFEIAEAYLRDALRQRPREQFPVDWAFTASNLAESLRHSTDGRLTDNLDSRLSEAVELGRRAGAIFRGTNDHAEMGRQVDINTGVSLLQIVAQRISERRINHVRDHALPEVLLPSIDHSEAAYDELLDIVARIADLAELNPGALASERTPDWAQALIALKTPDNNELRMLDEVISLGQEAAHHAESSVVQARAYRLTADALEAKSGSSRETADLYQAALDHFGALHDPNFLAETGMKTGSTWVTLGDWNQASRAFQRTVATIDELYSSRRTLRVQEEDLARYPKLIEAAAYASVRCGQYVEAVRTLERGRARQATRAVLRAEPDIPKVREIDATLATELESCARQEASDRSAAARTDNVLRAIRKLPGLSTFGITADDDDLVSASSEERPLIYVVSTPSGTASLAISPGKPLIVELLDDTGVTSTQLVRFQYQIDIERQTASGILSRNESTLDDT